jgi:hypothetical protein
MLEIEFMSAYEAAHRKVLDDYGIRYTRGDSIKTVNGSSLGKFRINDEDEMLFKLIFNGVNDFKRQVQQSHTERR